MQPNNFGLNTRAIFVTNNIMESVFLIEIFRLDFLLLFEIHFIFLFL